MTIYSLSIIQESRPDDGDRLAYFIDEKENKIIIFILNTKGHYLFLSYSEHMYHALRLVRELCVTKNQKLKFNALLKSLMITDIK